MADFGDSEYLKEFNAKGITYYIIPCIGYKNKNGKEGVIYYTNNRKYIDIDYPVLFGQNFVNKDIETDGLLTAYARIFKNLCHKIQRFPTD